MKIIQSLTELCLVVFLCACGGGGDTGSSSLSTNTSPLANAGANQTISSGTLVTLDGSSSIDVNGDPLSYSWTLTAKPVGSHAALSSTSAVKPTFTADMAGTYVASLVVNDGKANSLIVSTTVTATVNTTPVAVAGPDQVVIMPNVVTLNGSNSFDADSDRLTYMWTLTSKPTNSSVVLSGANVPSPTFVADLAGTYVVSLIVNDGKISSDPSTVVVVAITSNTVPVANAGLPQRKVKGSIVTLEGGASTDANHAPLTYAWTLISKPFGSVSELNKSTTVNPTFVADKLGTYVASLVVNNGQLNSAAESVFISVGSGKIPDSGITANQCYASGSDELVSCTSAAAIALNDQQDGMVGLDVTNPDNNDGKLGFSYTKLDANGNELPRNATTWSCIKDNITGLTWEIKTADDGMRDMQKTYSNREDNSSGDASAFVANVNINGLCGYFDWRVPTLFELVTIVDYSKAYAVTSSTPAIDGDWFTNTKPDNYWSSTAFVGDASQAWNIDFRCGIVGYCSRSTKYAVRLVR